jgi:multidrug efflux pump subunit AcrB
MAHKTDAVLIADVHNTSRFFVENRSIAWAVLVAVGVWGIYGYRSMPQRKDPEIAVRVAVAACQWPGASAQQVEELVTRPIEQTIAQNRTIHPPGPDNWGIRSLSLPGASFVYVQLAENTADSREQFNDINLKLQSLDGRLPQGASSIQFQSEFGDTATVMLTVASPPVDALEIQLRGQSVSRAITAARAGPARSTLAPVSIVFAYPMSLSQSSLERTTENFRQTAEQAGILDKSRLISGRGFLGVDGGTTKDDAAIGAFLENYLSTRLQRSEFDPDVWLPVIIRDPSDAAARLATVATAKYTYAELEEYTDLVGRTLLGVPQASRFERKGVLSQAIYLEYSQDRLAAYGVQVSDLSRLLNARNITLPSGTIEAGNRTIRVDPSGQFADAAAIGDVVVTTAANGAPVYLRDLVSVSRGYRTPADYLNYYTWRDAHGTMQRSRAVTVALYMRSGEQIDQFGKAIDAKLADLHALLPADLIVARTSDEPLQVHEGVGLFMRALYEAIALVVLIALVGFWEWRSALLMALSIPITLAMTFGLIHLVGIDLQQVSIATLIIALGLLVDDPVVANDAIKRDIARGVPRLHAAWLGPTKLARAILYATATNIIAYLPFLLLEGSTGEFLRSLPIVMTAALVASRLVSMTFIPLLGYYLLRPRKGPEPTLEERRERGFYGFYTRLSRGAIRHRWMVLGASMVFVAAGALGATTLKSQFFPEDVQYWFYVDTWLPNSAPLSATEDTAQAAERVVERVVAEFDAQHHEGDRPAGTPLLKSITTFVGGGGPRFWFSASPEQQQTNYAQVLVQLSSKEATPEVVEPVQAALTREIPGATLLVHQLQTNPVEFPVEVRVAGTSDSDPADEPADIHTLRSVADRVGQLLRTTPGTLVVQDDWFAETPEMKLEIDPDRANLAGLTNRDVAQSTQAAMTGVPVTTLREGDLQIPVIARLVPEQRANLSDIENLYVYSSTGPQKLPLRAVSTMNTQLVTQRIRRQEHFRTIGVHAWPRAGVLSSEVLARATPGLRAIEQTLPAGYRLEIGGEQAKQQVGFANLARVLLISLVAIYGALVLQFRSLVKPLLVFAATPYGVIGALIALSVMGTPFGFMAFLGIASLIGVIISHVIVLFDFIEEMHERGEPFVQAICDAGIERLRPVLITVGATILALFPLAREGGPLWQPLCFAQIGGLAVATFITLLLVPVLYSIAVMDLKIVKWEEVTP